MSDDEIRSNWALEAQQITKRFPGVLANDGVNFALAQGEVHALLGENGAGKSTLMNIIYGLYQPDEGNIFVNGRQVAHADPNAAIANGIGMVHQHFMLVPVFSVLENIMLGAEVTRGLTLDVRAARKEIRQLSRDYGLDIDPDAIVETLPVGVQQRVEIMKALYRDARILVLDEPTAVLTPQEAEDLFVIMRQLTARGVSIIFITHKLKEVLAVSDSITVMRRGRVVGKATPSEIDEAGLAALMVGRDVLLDVTKDENRPGAPILEIEQMFVIDERGLPAVDQLSLTVQAGEILGIAGVQGNGQTELVEAITGLRGMRSGQVKLKGVPVQLENPRYLVENGVAHIPEDRHKHGLVLGYSVADNLTLAEYYKSPFAKRGQRDDAAIASNATARIAEFDVRTPSEETQVGKLSGGNQQKVIIARELNRPVQLLIANQPTRGLDVGSIEFIHRRIVEQRDAGVAVMLVSAELDEILALSDRIAVMFHGKIIAVMPAAEATRERLGLLMAGSSSK